MFTPRRLLLLSVVLIVGLSLLPAAAQKETSNALLDMLALVPVGGVTNEDAPLWSFVDYRALEAARGIPSPGSRVAFEADEESERLWVNTYMRVMSGPYFDALPVMIEEAPEVVGFDFFDIDRGLLFGSPPRTGMILNGHQIEPGRLYTPTEWAEMKGVATKTLAKNRSQRRGSLSSWLVARSIAAALTSSRTTTRTVRRPGEKLRGSTPPPSPGGSSSDISSARKRSRRVGAPQGHVRARGVAWSESASPA